MAWGGMGGGGGGGMFGPPMGGGMGSAANPGGGLPFAGIPSELMAGVERLLDSEPDHPEPTVEFTQRRTDLQPLTIRRMVVAHYRALTIAIVLVVIETVALQMGPYLTQVGIDQGVVTADETVLITVGVLYVLSVIIGALASRGRVRWSGLLSAEVMNDLRRKVFAHLQRLSLDFYTSEKGGVIMTRMTSDIEILQQFLQDGLTQFGIQGLTMVIVAVVLFSYNVELAIITVFIIVPVLTVFSLWFRAASNNGYGRVRDGLAGVLSDLQESLAGVRVVAAHNRQKYNVVHHRNVVGRYRDANDYTAHINGVYGPGTDMFSLVAQGVLLLIGGNMVRSGSLTIGELTAFVLYLNAFFLPIQQLVQLYTVYQQGQAAVIKLRGLLLTPPTVDEAPDAVDLPPIHGEIVFENVEFAYDSGVPVLSDVNLRIAEGESVALVGPTGAGKSTLAKLVTRFYDPAAGRVLIDGHDLRSVTISSLRRQLGVVPQEPFLFVGTIRDNVSFARPGASDDEVWDALGHVGLGDLVERLPHGLDTEVHERGQSLSSGERQLLALARAFFAQPRVLVLDEATSNLDHQSEVKIERALDTLLEGRTSILVAHRLSTAMRADRIVVVDGGGILEVGSHDELLARGGRYADMYATWVSHNGSDPVAVSP